MTGVSAELTAGALLILVATATRTLHRRPARHAERNTLRTYSPTRSDPRPPASGNRSMPLPRPLPPAVPADRHDHRDGGLGRFPARRRRNRTTHKHTH